MDEPVHSTPVSVEPAGVASQKPVPPPGALFRQDVNETVEQGLGYFLQRVSVDPDIVNGRFHGFRITDLRPVEWWQGVDLKPGDVVLQVNGMPIERDIDAYQAFQALRAAPALRVSFERAGVKRELVYTIVERDGKPSKAAPASAPSPSPSAPPKAKG
jgi:type II secretory pathway component PulC